MSEEPVQLTISPEEARALRITLEDALGRVQAGPLLASVLEQLVRKLRPKLFVEDRRTHRGEALTTIRVLEKLLQQEPSAVEALSNKELSDRLLDEVWAHISIWDQRGELVGEAIDRLALPVKPSESHGRRAARKIRSR